MTAGQTDKATNVTNATARHDLSDWLELHTLDAAQCRQILQDWPEPRTQPRAQKAQSAPASELPTAAVAWDMARAALRAEFEAAGDSGAGDIIDAAHAQTQTLFQPDPQKYPRAFTVNDGGQGVPLVVCNYQGRVADIMTLAHEFGHAVQIIASGGRFVPPVAREVCAFLSERAMLAYLQHQQPEIYGAARQVWQGAAVKNWRKERADLLRLLGDLATPYNYQWNYPLARSVVSGIDENDPARFWPLFEGDLDPSVLWNL